MKTSNPPLERKRPLLFTAGLVFAFSITLVSFEWRTPYYKVVDPFVDDPFDGLDVEYVYEPLAAVHVPKERPKLPSVSLTTDLVISNDAMIPDDIKRSDIDDTPIEGVSMDPDIDDDDLFAKTAIPATTNAEYCGGNEALSDFLAKHLRYPEIPLSMGVSGVVYVQFVVDRSGSLRDAKVIRPVDPWLDAEALRVAKLLDCFTPGMQAGRAVDVYFNLPVRFRIK